MDSLHLDGGDVESHEEVMVPKQLLSIWDEFIHIINRMVCVKMLLEKIKEGGVGKEVGATWVVILAEGMAGIRI